MDPANNPSGVSNRIHYEIKWGVVPMTPPRSTARLIITSSRLQIWLGKAERCRSWAERARAGTDTSVAVGDRKLISARYRNRPGAPVRDHETSGAAPLVAESRPIRTAEFDHDRARR